MLLYTCPSFPVNTAPSALAGTFKKAKQTTKTTRFRNDSYYTTMTNRHHYIRFVKIAKKMAKMTT